eukprot:TRINITY_DN1219_c0_g3_i1.p1 TRINITY_DN1219_c0_g3~~TRINITY_DN1219_c0_g3_i1.p1  ORF type:complete len:371 (+),score=60.76 TRINITY_DN1219_c0_g3_i1:1383-2495(+)
MYMTLRRCLGNQRRRMTDELAGLWLHNLKPQNNRGRRDADVLQGEYVASQMKAELELLKSEGWDLGDRAYSTAIAAVAGYGNSEVAQQFFDDMVDSGKKPGPKVFISLLFAYSHDRKDREGERFFSTLNKFQLMYPDYPPSDAFVASVIHGLCKQNRFELALEAANAFKRKGVLLSIRVYNMLIAACEDMTDASRLLEEMKEEAVSLDVVSYGSLFKVCSKTLDTVEAERLMRELKASGLELTVKEWTGYLTVFKAAGCHEKVVAIWDEMIANNIEPNSIAYGALIKSHCDAMETTRDPAYGKRAIAVFKDAMDSECVTSSRLVTVMMELYSKQRNAAAAEELFTYASSRKLVDGYCKKYYSLATGKQIR